MTRNSLKLCLRTGFAIAAIVAAFAIPTQAFASDCSNATTDATAAQYCPPSAVIAAGGGTSGASTVSAPSSLPFTGLDVISLLAVAVALGGAGLVLRRLSVRGGEQS